MLIGGALSWFASADPDGLEWAAAKVSGKEEIEAPETGIYASLDALQKRIAFLPDYGFKKDEAAEAGASAASVEETKPEAAAEPWPNINAGTSLSGVLGGFMTLCLAGMLGILLRRKHSKA